MLQLGDLCLVERGKGVLVFCRPAVVSDHAVSYTTNGRTNIIWEGPIREQLEEGEILRVLLAASKLPPQAPLESLTRALPGHSRTSWTFGVSSSSANTKTPGADVASWINFAAAAPLADLHISRYGSSFAVKLAPRSMANEG